MAGFENGDAANLITLMRL